MVTTVKILKRRDASSLVVAIILALTLNQLLPMLTSELASKLTPGLSDDQAFGYSYPGSSWEATYLLPLISVGLQLILLELALWTFTSLVAYSKKK